MARREWPEDVGRYVLSMLPVKSLLRFRCVCKPWCALIKSPSFIAHHLINRASTRKTAIVKRTSLLQQDHRYVLSFISDDQTLSTDTNTDIDIHTVFPKDEMYVLLLGTCNGLLCITHYCCIFGTRTAKNLSGIILCNPSIREFKVVPVPPFTYPHSLTGTTRAVGFGFDPLTGDSKVVRIVELCGDGLLDSFKVEVYNLSCNSWKEIDAIVTSLFFYAPSSPTLVNGAFHWYAIGVNFSDASILSFHISNEVTQMIPLPDITSYEYEDPYGSSESLIALNESSLALIVHDLKSRVDNHIFDIWVMTEYGVKESWTRRLKIGPLSGIDRPLASWNSGSELLMKTRNGQLVSYNLQDKNIKEFPVHGVPDTFSVVTYSESLVSLNRENEIEESA